MVRIVFLIISCFFLGGCDTGRELSGSFDLWAFSCFGETWFQRAEEITLRAVHLSTAVLNIGDVVVEGRVETVSANGTYLVLADDGGRLLVLLADVKDPERSIRGGRSLRILGGVESGKKGLPYLRARAVNVRYNGVRS